MRHQILANPLAIRRRTWPALVANFQLLMLGAAVGLIAAIVVGAPHLRLP